MIWHPYQKIMHPFSSLLLLTVALSLASCGASRKIGNAELKEKSSAEAVLKAMATNRIDVDWLEAKAKLDVNNGSQAVRANALVRMKKNELVWISVRKLGFEAGRALIRRDSVFVINRLNNEYYAEPLAWLEREYNIPADLVTFQNLLLGNLIFLSTASFELDEQGEHLILSGKGGGVESRFKVLGKDLSLREMWFDDKKNQHQLRYTLDEYAPIAGKKNFSHLRFLEVRSPDTGHMTLGLQFSDVIVNEPKDIKFDIPERYTRVQGK